MARLQSLNDAPATQREYETIYILRPTTANDGVAEVNTRVKNIIETMGGKVLKVDNWGKRRLAYEVAKERKGIYLYWQYLANPGVVEEFERNLRMLDSVIRYLTIKVDVDVDPTAKPGEIDAEAYDRAANTAADEEDLFLSRPNEGGHHDDEYGGYGDDDDGDVIPGSALKKEKEAAAAAEAAAAPAAEPTKDEE
jgi:small subunit ribosomal protein S6